MADFVLREYDSKMVFDLGTKTPGETKVPYSIQGNSIYSLLYVEASDVGATVKIQYYGYTDGYDAGQAVMVGEHDLLTGTNQNDAITMSNLPHQGYVTCVVAGGNATFSLYMRVVVSSVSAIDDSLKREGDLADFDVDKGSPTVVYDPMQNRWVFARGAMGIQDVRIVGNVVAGEPGTSKFLDARIESTPGLEQEVLSYTVPTGKVFNLLSVKLVCTADIAFDVLADSAVIDSGKTGPACPNANFPYRIARPIPSGAILTVKAKAASYNPSATIDLYIQGTLS